MFTWKAGRAAQPTITINFVLQNVGSDDKYRFEIKDILEMEMKLLEALDYYLVVYHPYRPLLQYDFASLSSE
jgi:cyclin C